MKNVVNGVKKAAKTAKKYLGKDRKKHINTAKGYLANSWCYYVYENIPLDENLIFVESRDGKDFTGNIFRIVEELQKPEYGNKKFCVYATKNVQDRIKKYAQKYNFDLSRMRFEEKESRAVVWMERAKYLVSDSGIPWKYVKRDGQIMLNTWHGTPLKVMGRYIPGEKHTVGTVQHFFFSSDYLLYPSYYMKDTMLKSYMVENAASGKALMAGYPRNSVFFDQSRRAEIRKELGMGEKTVYVYMPTHRGNYFKMKNRSQLADVIDFMSELDISLTEKEEVLVKLHVFNQSKIDFAQFEHIKPFPEEYETYDVLNAADGLITDYSSVMFDYANARRKIILFTYDEEEYFEDRGVYFPLSDMPFPAVKDVQHLLLEMRSGIAYDDTAFLDRFCTFDSADATEKVCHHVFLNESTCKEEKLGNGKENVLIFGGSLAKNGITSALYSLLNSIDCTKRNYFLAYRRDDINADPSRVESIPEHIDYLPLMNDDFYTFNERWKYDRFCSSKDWDQEYPQILHHLFKREWNRYYYGVRFDYLLQFDGYGKNVNMLFMESDIPKAIFVHSNMEKELNEKTNQHRATLRRCYSSFDRVAIVSPELMSPTTSISQREDNVTVVHNVFDAKSVRKRGEFPIEFQKDTLLRCWDPNGLNGFLNSDGFKFVTVGRFSQEKGHMRLIAAFEKFSETHPGAKLLIIGGYGMLYDKTVSRAMNSKKWKDIYILRSIANPMPIVKKCDLFILSSYYEGLSGVLLEADALGVPAIATDISGTHYLLTEYSGCLVENSENGLLQGMNDFVDGKIHTLTIDYDAYFHQAIDEFESLFEG